MGMGWVTRPLAVLLQRILLHGAYWVCRLWPGRRAQEHSWVVGVEELAALVKYVSQAIPGSFSVSLSCNRMYDFTYGFSLLRTRWSTFDLIRKLVIGPILLGYLATRSRGFFYIGAMGFLLGHDGREAELRFLRGKKRKIVCFFCGSDIRSPRLMKQLEQNLQLENIATYLSLVSPQFLTEEYDHARKLLAEVSERYADIIFNAAVDQRSYLTRPTHPFVYFYPEANFHRDPAKFQNISLVKIVHAPSQPLIKGTQIVRAAITRLRREGYDFEYVEFSGVKNHVVLEGLRTAHIVLNEFYAFVPGVFGVEAMANYCVLLTSADETIETGLPKGSNGAWVVTKYYEIYDRLKEQLDHPERFAAQAEAGYNWALEHAATASSGKRLCEVLGGV